MAHQQKTHEKRIADSRKRSFRLLGKITKSSPKNRPRYVRRLLESYDARVAAVSETNRKKKLNLKPSRILQIAGEISAFEAHDEPARVKAVLKDEGGIQFRYFYDFGVKRQSCQRLVEKVVKAQLIPSKQQYLYRGGRQIALKKAIDAIEAGYVYARHVDIRNFFGSINRKEITKLLPLPVEVTINVVSTVSTPIYFYGFLEEFLSDTDDYEWVDHLTGCTINDAPVEARLGIPFGSAASPAVAEYLLSPILKGMETDCKIVCYMDNFLILGRAVNDVKLTTTALRSALYCHPAGPLTLSHVCSGGPGDKIEFLGYDICRKSSGIEIAVSHKNALKFRDKCRKFCKEALRKESSPSKRRGSIASFFNYSYSWSSSFKEAIDSNLLRKKVTYEFAEKLVDAGEFENLTTNQKFRGEKVSTLFWG